MFLSYERAVHLPPSCKYSKSKWSTSRLASTIMRGGVSVELRCLGFYTGGVFSSVLSSARGNPCGPGRCPERVYLRTLRGTTPARNSHHITTAWTGYVWHLQQPMHFDKTKKESSNVWNQSLDDTTGQLNPSKRSSKTGLSRRVEFKDQTNMELIGTSLHIQWDKKREWALTRSLWFPNSLKFYWVWALFPWTWVSCY